MDASSHQLYYPESTTHNDRSNAGSMASTLSFSRAKSPQRCGENDWGQQHSLFVFLSFSLSFFFVHSSWLSTIQFGFVERRTKGARRLLCVTTLSPFIVSF